MNLVDIVIDQRDESATGTLIDDDFDEPVAGAETRQNSFTVRGQIRNGRDERLNRTRTGDAAESTGHVLFRKADLDAAGITLQKGDRISSVAGVPFDVEIVDIKHGAPLSGSFLLVTCPFKEVASRRESL